MEDVKSKNRFQLLNSFWSVFWLLTVSVSFSLVIGYFFRKITFVIQDLNNLYPTNLLILAWCIFAFIFLSLFVFIVRPVDKLKTQEIHQEPSWVFYTYWGTINSFLIISAIVYFSDYNRIYLTLKDVFFSPLGFALLIPLAVLFFKWVCEYWAKSIDLTFTRFASGSVGINHDGFGFKIPARHAARGLLKLDDYVEVVGLYGGLGFGKSSYTRMILESLVTHDTLYTYISLTETNEAKDFSRLFSDRWTETLSERYPKIDVTACLPVMDPILRESGNGILSDLLKILSAMNFGLLKTKVKFSDKFYSPNKPDAAKSIAKLFGNITNIKESHWVVVIDEIERAEFEEIYRLIEIIERFKNEGRSGLPTKLLFLLCISEPDLKKYLDSFSEIDPRANLLKTFFYANPKSITHKIFLPAVTSDSKKKFVMDLLNKVIEREGLDVPRDINPSLLLDPSRSFMGDKDSLEYIVAVLSECSPRTIGRVITELDFFYEAFRNKLGDLRKDSIRFSDIVALGYIKIQYPFLIDFFTKTIHLLVNQGENNNADAYFVKKDLEDEKKGLIGWIEKETRIQISKIEETAILKMVGLVMHYYFDFLKKGSSFESKETYFNTTSYPEVMADYLSLSADGTETTYRTNNRLYQQHKISFEPIYRLGDKDF